MPSKNLISHILEAYSLPKELETKVFEEAQKRLSPLDTFDEIFDYTKQLIEDAKEEKRAIERRKREESKRLEVEEQQQSVSLYQKIREAETSGEGRFIPYEKLLKLLVAFPHYMNVSRAAREAGIARKTAKKYLTLFGFNVNYKSKA
jgi:hypothetical protein